MRAKIVALLWVLLACETRAAAIEMRKIPEAECAKGAATTLWKSAELPVTLAHDGPEGQTTFSVHTANGQVLGTHALHGEGRCLGYVAERKAYVIVSAHEIGAIVPFVELLLLDESGAVTPTRFGKDGYIAWALVASESKRRVAFIGQIARGEKEGELALYVLDVVTDAIQRLGKAPAPPPLETALADFARRRWQWGVDGMDGFADLEPNMLRFDGETLRVSYGPDTVKARAKKRSVKTFALGARR